MNKSKSTALSKKPHPRLTPIYAVESRVIFLRHQRVMLDADIAELYGVPVKRLNEQVKRNRERFPSDFMFQLTEKEQAA
ncbi:MAG: ORF6N domain-containing protein [Candidatus Sulfotelmatobacter sp.]